jgi:hypothetical protein
MMFIVLVAFIALVIVRVESQSGGCQGVRVSKMCWPPAVFRFFFSDFFFFFFLSLSIYQSELLALALAPIVHQMENTS